MKNDNFFAAEFAASIAAGCQHGRDEVARLRYDVFCREFGFEPANPAQRETDAADHYAEYALVRSLAGQQLAGCIRVVMPGNDAELLPIEQHCMTSLHRDSVDLASLPRRKVCEISRLAVSADFRGDSGKSGREGGKKPAGQYASLVSMALYTLAAIIALRHGRTHVVAMMERRLARGLRFSGIPCRQIGQEIDYHGLRAPYYITADQLLSGIAWKYPELVDAIQHQLGEKEPATGFAPALAFA